MRFVKMHGIGNDFVMVDVIRDGLPAGDLGELSRLINDRRRGVGGDGLILVEKGEQAPFRMRMFNPDGTESEMCGNGVRCFAKLARDQGHTRSAELEVETGAGLLKLQLLQDGRVRVDMGKARLKRGEIGMVGPADETFQDQPADDAYRGTAVSMGNPHLVIFVSDVQAVPLSDVGPRLERHPFFPERVNVHFAQILDRDRIRQRTWERGAGATLACGTGACAVAVAAHVNGLAGSRTRIFLPGGELEIEVLPDRRVWMTGPAETVFIGEWT